MHGPPSDLHSALTDTDIGKSKLARAMGGPWKKPFLAMLALLMSIPINGRQSDE